MTVTEENDSQFYSLQVTAKSFTKEDPDLKELGEATKEEEEIDDLERDAGKDIDDSSQEPLKIEFNEEMAKKTEATEQEESKTADQLEKAIK